MNSLKNSDASELNTGSSTNQIPFYLETQLRLKLEESQRFLARFQNIKELYLENEDPDDRERIFYLIQMLFDLQICKEDLYSFPDFERKYQQYMSDVLERYHNYRSDLIADENLIYALGLYRKYVKDSYAEFLRKFKRCGRHYRILKYLLSYPKFEKCLYYHAYSLCVQRGIESPDYDDVNKMISTKPYGDSSLYPQNEIWQIVGFPGDSDNNAYRDYYCGLAIWKHNSIIKQKHEETR